MAVPRPPERDPYFTGNGPAAVSFPDRKAASEVSGRPLEQDTGPLPLPPGIHGSFLERHSDTRGIVNLTPYVKRCNWTLRTREPWTTIEPTLVLPFAKRDLAPEIDDVLTVRDPKSFPLAWGYVGNAPTPGVMAGPKGEVYSPPITPSAESWLVRLRKAQIYASPADTAAAGAGQSSGVGTLFTADEWLHVVNTVTGMVDGQVGRRMSLLLRLLARLILPKSLGGGQLGDLIGVAFDAESSGQYAGGIPCDPILGPKLTTVSSAFPASTNVLDMLLGVAVPDREFIEFFETLEPSAHESHDGRHRLGATPVLVHRLFPGRVRPLSEAFREYFKEEIAAPPPGIVMDAASAVAYAAALKQLETAIASLEAPSWRPDLGPVFELSELLTFEPPTRSDSARINAVTVGLPTGGSDPVRFWRDAGLPIQRESDVWRNGLRLYQPRWPYFAPDGLGIVPWIKVIAALAADDFLGVERFYRGSFTTRLRPDLKVGRVATIRFPDSTRFECYVEQIANSLEVGDRGEVSGRSVIQYSRGAWVPKDMRTAPTRSPMKASTRPAPKAAPSTARGLAAKGKVFIGGWAYPNALANPDATIDRAKRGGVRLVDVMVNGNERPEWHVQPFDKIRAAVAKFQAAKLSVSLTSWMRPRPDWYAGIEELAALCEELGVGLTLDLEEPWVEALAPTLLLVGATAVEAETERVFQSIRQHYRGNVAVTGIVFANTRVLGPAVRRCEIAIPQAFATAKNTGSHEVGWLERVAITGWREMGASRVVLGQWCLPPDPDHPENLRRNPGYGFETMEETMQASLGVAVEAGIDEVRFWNLSSLYGERAKVTKEHAR